MRQDYALRPVDLSSGRVPGDVDVLVVVAPQGMGDEERFAIDQFLMRGGAVVVAGGSYALAPQQFPGALSVQQLEGGLQEMLASYGVTVDAAMVLDPQNEPFPVQVQRDVAGMQVVELQELAYPYFVDVRQDAMDEENPIVANLPAVTMQWTSALALDDTKNQDREVSVLLQSTDQSWLRSATDVQPNPQEYPPYGFPVEGEQEARPLAVALRGSFESFFKDRASPFEASSPSNPGEAQSSEMGATAAVTDTEASGLGTIQVSPESARLVVFGSNEFIDDTVLEISSRLSADRYLNNLQLIQNAVDWSVEDEDLLSIRSGGTQARLLKPLNQQQQSRWEILNYGLALLALVAIGGVWIIRRRNQMPMELVDTTEAAGEAPDGEPAFDTEGQGQVSGEEANE
jgi:ABC-2 type transport system permease protein